MHLDNQCRDLIWRNTMMPQVATDNANDLNAIDPRRRALFCHRRLPDFFDLGRRYRMGLKVGNRPRWLFFKQSKLFRFCTVAT